MRSIPEIRREIRLTMEKGAPMSELEAELEKAIVAEQKDKLIKEDAEFVSNRLQKKENADKLVSRANTQRENIAALLQARNEVLAPLRKALEKAQALPKLHDKCFEQFHDMIQAGSLTRGLDGTLPDDFTFPMLQLGDGRRDAYDISREALYYLQMGHGLLVALNKVEHKPALGKTDDDGGL